MANVMRFYRGAVSYAEVDSMPLFELIKLQKAAEKINNEIKESLE